MIYVGFFAFLLGGGYLVVAVLAALFTELMWSGRIRVTLWQGIFYAVVAGAGATMVWYAVTHAPFKIIAG